MDQLPEMVKTALSTACKSGRSLSWKMQENSKRILIQLVCKAEPVNGSTGGKTTRVEKSHVSHTECSVDGNATGMGSNRKNGMELTDKSSNAGRLQIKKRIGPSRVRMYAKCLQAFLD